MNPIQLYRRFNPEFFYSFHKHSTDLELEELAHRYSACLDKHGEVINDILAGNKPPDSLRMEIRKNLDFLAESEAKFARDLPLEITGEHFECETQFNSIEGILRGLVEGQGHLVRLVKPSEYDRNYWFYTQGDHLPQNVYCSEFGLDLIEYLKAIRIGNRRKLSNLRRAIAYRQQDIPQFWTLAPYLHQALMQRGCTWSLSIMTIMRIASKKFARDGRPFTGEARFQLGYDERMPTHLLSRMEAMRDVACLQEGVYAEQYGITLPD